MWSGFISDPPDKALVLCVDEADEKTLDRTQARPAHEEGPRRRHDPRLQAQRHHETLFAALNMLDGSVIGTCMPRHRHREFLHFLKLIDQRTPAGLALHLIVDNYATHKTPAVKRWLKAHPRFHLHFTPTSASWLNMVERFFAEITRNRIRRGAFKSVAELKDAIMQYLEKHNADPKPFVWTKSADRILKKSPERNSVKVTTLGRRTALASDYRWSATVDSAESFYSNSTRECSGEGCE